MLRYPVPFTLATILLTGCASLEREARDALIEQLPPPQDATFEELHRYPGDVVCGRYSATGLMGSRVRKRDFVYSGGIVYPRATAQQLALYCTEEPAAALERELGIGPWQNGEGTLGRIRSDLKAITGAIAAHVTATGDVPLSGLAELAPPAGGWLEELPEDPWGNAYHYEVGLGGRTQRNYRLYTLGADDRPGGTGADADVGREHLPYLDRLARL